VSIHYLYALFQRERSYQKQYNMDNNNAEITTLAGGCFWCTEAIFKRLKGIKSVLPGYAGGIVKNPSYDQVCTGKTVFYHNQKQKEIAEKSKKILKKKVFTKILL
jgi:peptide methionine sulfoxide reductase MsrA